MRKIKLEIELAENGKLWGTISYEDNLLIDSHDEYEGLLESMKTMLNTFYGLDKNSIDFEIITL